MSRLLLVFSIFLTQIVLAEGLDDVRAYLDATYSPDRPGASVVIAKDGEIIHEAGYGLANVEHGIANNPDTIFRIGSVTKQFTGAAIMLLQQRGELSVNDPIGKYLPDYPTHGHEITIYHLLNHTSGIKSYTGIPGYMDQGVRPDLTTEELIDVFENLPMEFSPGDSWNYNNSGYVLLGAIIEEVSGQSYADFIAENIAGPLGLDSTLYGGPQIIPNRASGYATDDNGNVVNAGFISMSQPHAAGSLLSTTGDLVKWHKALTGGEFIHDDSYKAMTTPADLNDGGTYPYGFGLGVGLLREREMIAHGGGIHGFTCYSLWLPDEDIYIAVLANGATDGPGPTTVAKKIAAMAIGDPYPSRESVKLSDADLNGLSGNYAGPTFPPVTVSVDDGEIIMDMGFNEALLLAESRELLYDEDGLEYFVVAWDAGTASSISIYFEEGVPPEVLTRVE